MADLTSFLEVKDLVCFRRESAVVGPLSFSVSTGQVLHVVGQNGSGKSSLLQSVVGLWSCYRGCIRCSKATYIGTQRGLRTGLSVWENMQWFQCLQAVTLLDQGASLLQAVRLFKQKDCLVEQLSEGQKQRLSLLRLFVSKRSLWILDEPFLALDDKARLWFTHVLATHLKKGGGVLLSSHQALSGLANATCLELAS